MDSASSGLFLQIDGAAGLDDDGQQKTEMEVSAVLLCRGSPFKFTILGTPLTLDRERVDDQDGDVPTGRGQLSDSCR
jgi:hypothetical protein